MLEKKLAECRYAYEEELEYITAQFEQMQLEVIAEKEEKEELKKMITHLEGIII